MILFYIALAISVFGIIYIVAVNEIAYKPIHELLGAITVVLVLISLLFLMVIAVSKLIGYSTSTRVKNERDELIIVYNYAKENNNIELLTKTYNRIKQFNREISVAKNNYNNIFIGFMHSKRLANTPLIEVILS